MLPVPRPPPAKAVFTSPIPNWLATLPKPAEIPPVKAALPKIGRV